jgi:glycerophosphoryl diester phosphodiesterase
MKRKLYFYGLLLFITSCTTMKKPINIGHRGAMGHETENTIASVKKALELGVDMIEIDVFVLKTGEVVVFHDENLDNLTNAKGKIEEYSYSELQKVIVDGNHKIPTLEEIINAIDKKVPLNIELKGKNTAKPTHEILSTYYKKDWSKKDFVISSFLWDELKIFRRLDKKIPIAILTEENPSNAIPTGIEVKAFAINPWYKTLTKENVDYLHKRGFKVNTYTVNEPEEIENVIELGVDGIFCNFPERIK